MHGRQFATAIWNVGSAFAMIPFQNNQTANVSYLKLYVIGKVDCCKNFFEMGRERIEVRGGGVEVGQLSKVAGLEISAGVM